MKRIDLDGLAERVLAGDRAGLARAITLVESTRSDDRVLAQHLLERLMERTGGALRIGISGVPGVGKSTFIDAFGAHAISRGHRLAVLAVDPSSSSSGGSILGDKTRMQTLSGSDKAYIRASPTGGTLGGVARKTRENLLLCEAAGFDVVLVETVGVGQSETAVANMTDMFLLLVLPGAGDELQGIKRGIMELVDLLVINKADGELETLARRTAADYAGALRLLPARTSGWSVPVCVVSALCGTGIAEAWEQVERFSTHLHDGGRLIRRRASQAKQWMWDEAVETFVERLRQSPQASRVLDDLERRVTAGDLPPSSAARRLLESFLEGEVRGHDR